MNDKQIIVFMEVAKTESIRKAADNLFMSESSISRQISSLEDEIGITLFTHRGNALKLSVAGQSFYKDSLQFQKSLLAAISKAKGLTSNQIRIATPNYMMAIMPTIMTNLSEAGYDIHIHNFLSCNFPSLLEYYNVPISIAITEDIPENPKIKVVPLFETRHYCMVSMRNPLAYKDMITIKDLTNETLVKRDQSSFSNSYETMFSVFTTKLPNNPVRYEESALCVETAIAANLGIAFSPMKSNHPEIRSIPVDIASTISISLFVSIDDYENYKPIIEIIKISVNKIEK